MIRQRGGKVRSPSAPDRMDVVSLIGMGIGGIVGAGYFLGSGLVIKQAGPGILVTYLVGALLLAQVMGALASLSMDHPVSAYREYITQYLGTFPGYLLGWTVFVSGLVGLGSEAVAMATFSRYWVPHLPLAAMATGFAVAAVLMSALGTRRVGRLESGMSAIKIALLLGFMVVGGIAVLGRIHPGAPMGIPLWFTGGGPFPHGAGGVLGATLIVVFSYSGVTTVAMAEGRVLNPKKNVPRAALGTVLGVGFLYVGAMAVLLLMVPWNQTSAAASPFLLGLHKLNIPGSGAVFNAVILVASFSVMAGGFYGAAWMLVSLAEHLEAPRWFKKRHDALPNAALVAAGVVLLASLSAAYILPGTAYVDLTAAGSYFSLLNWMMILLAFLVWQRRRGPRASVVRLAFGAPYGAALTIGVLLAIGVASVTNPGFRPGFWVFAAIFLAVAASFALVRRPAET